MLQKSNKPSKGKFVKRRLTEDNYKARAEQPTGAMFDSIFKRGFDVYKVKQGENTIRFLPPTWDDPEHYGFDVYVHYSVGANRGSYICLAKMQNKPCPICEAAEESDAAGEGDEAKKLRPSRRVVAWIIDRDGEKGLPELFSQAPTVDRDITEQCRTKRGTVFIQDEDEGRDVIFKRKGTTLTTTEYYGFKLDTENTPISEDNKKQQEILDFIEENPVPSTLLYQTYDYLKQVIEGAVEERDEDLDEVKTDDEEDEEAPRTKTKVKAKGKPPFEEDDDEDDDEVTDESDDSDSDDNDDANDGDEEEDEEEDERPAAKAKVKAKARDEESEDEDEDDDEPPRRGRVSLGKKRH